MTMTEAHGEGESERDPLRELLREAHALIQQLPGHTAHSLWSRIDAALAQIKDAKAVADLDATGIVPPPGCTDKTGRGILQACVSAWPRAYRMGQHDENVCRLLHAALSVAAAPQPPAVNSGSWTIEAAEKIADAFALDYEPEDRRGVDDGERFLICDAIRGLLADDTFIAAMRGAPQLPAGKSEE